MNNKKLLRFLIVIELIILIVGGPLRGPLISITGEKNLPIEMQSYIRAQAEIPLSLPITILMVLVVFLKLISSIGVFFLWRPARFLYLLVMPIDIVAGVFTGDAVTPVLERASLEFACVVAGLIIGLLYFSDVRSLFEKKGNITARNIHYV